MIKWFLFDLGGVIVPDSTNAIDEHMAEYFELEYQEYLKVKNKYQIVVSEGRITLEEFFKIVSTRTNVSINSKDVIEEYMLLYQKLSAPWDIRILNLLSILKEKYRIACLTNTEKEVTEYNKKRGLFDYFEIAFLSSEIGLQKPDREVYKYVINQLNCLPNEILFIDDKTPNLVTANDMGINCFQYCTFEDFSAKILSKYL